ncbi:glycoside hydrolase family 2 protein [Fulvivirga sp. M361]|uniref:glycoside hydrolase family 2 TIM barrel-domain containing protein n=1 Tax=Fulvivirga sp. M361 TaxID=2594266 RepID=UPI001179AC4F|nr:glycoside hydrolase family 2 TIM barrel-domain containing protein [Fulvivirga sp. M361]TRX60629.1 glycoside hydrolase family 2 protein [Fulvivirga sp. M361]
MKKLIVITCCLAFLLSGCQKPTSREVQDFNFDWRFHLGEAVEKEMLNQPDNYSWKEVRLPHDWSSESSFTQVETGSSTGFLPAGIGWYKKDFSISEEDKGKVVSIEFDGVYNNAQVWINGTSLGERPYGYSSFSHDLTPYLNVGDVQNTLLVKVDHSNYLDSRWYTGSGIYRDVRLVKRSNVHIPQWGVFVTTPNINAEQASVAVTIDLAKYDNGPAEIALKGSIFSQGGAPVTSLEQNATVDSSGKVSLEFTINDPIRWDISAPHLYTLKLELMQDGHVIDEEIQTFGIRTARFDADKGFFLNEKNIKLKGVNLHHAAGAVGSAVPVDVWRRRFEKLKSIGCNAIRTAHNPVDPKFLDLCDEMGFLVINEFFDEWNIPKEKSLHKLGDNLAPDEVTHGYSEQFDKWAERDLKDCMRRDRNHPSIILWSIGNEIEWTHPYYSQAYEVVNGKQEYYQFQPSFDSMKIKKALDEITGGKDSLLQIAKKLVNWVKEMDTTRPVTAGNVLPSVGLASGYGQSVDVLGFNYRATEYDGAHATYPDLLIYGSENWGAWSEWKNCIDRDFVAGIFCWTGFAYAGESGPWPLKGLNISFFDFAGFKTPRGHFFETLWKEEPHVYMGTTPEDESEFSYDPKTGFSVEYKDEWIRRWAWYDIYDKWQYETKENIIVQVYSNCEENELFLNGESLGRKPLVDFKEDNIIKWIVPYEAGTLKVVGYQNGKEVADYSLSTTSEITDIDLSVDKTVLKANHYDVVHVEARLRDKNGVLVTHAPTLVHFEVDGDMRLLGIDNGSASNVQNYKAYQCESHNGKVLLMLQANGTAGEVKIIAKANSIRSEVTLQIE